MTTSDANGHASGDDAPADAAVPAEERGRHGGAARGAAESVDPTGTVSDSSDPYARERQTFPRLTDEQLERLRAYACEEHPAPGTWLFERGQRGVDFFVVVDGAIEIVETRHGGDEAVITVHGPSQFTGELDLFNDRKILVGGRTRGDSTVLRVPRARFRKMMTAETDLAETVMRAFILRRTGFLVHEEAGVVLYGVPNGGETLRIRRFLSRNGYPLKVVDSTAPGAADALPGGCEIDPDRLPAVVLPSEGVLHRPSNLELADRLGLTEPLEEGHVHDLAVVGAGPAGLSAAVYAASESLDTVVVEVEAPGGQAGTSSRIENFLGFPTGISGQALAGRAWIQSQKFGARFVVSRAVASIDCDERPFRLELDADGAGAAGTVLRARAVVVATGATYRRLGLEGQQRYEGQGIHYAATAIEAQLCAGEEIVVVGGGNSAGQAAVYLSRHASHVHVLVRGDSLADSMSDYLVQRIDSSARITLHTGTSLVELHGERLLERVTWERSPDGERETRDVGNVFVMIGAVPNSDWLDGCVETDERGFVRTGAGVRGGTPVSPFETSVSGIFAVGDVRSGSVKRVASGVGEGSVAIQAVHAWLADDAARDDPPPGGPASGAPRDAPAQEGVA